MPPNLKGAVFVFTAMLLVLVPAGLLVWLRFETAERLSGLEPDPEPMLVTVATREIAESLAVAVEPEWGAPPVVVAPAWSGTVTRLLVAPGDRVSSGDRVVRVDGVDRVAWATEEPFWRRLARRDRGPDVTMLQELLSEAGFYSGEIDGVFGRRLEAAVKDWAGSLGVVKPDGGFDPGWVLWLPVEPFEVAAATAAAGLPAPASGSAVLEGRVPLLSLGLRETDDHVFARPGEWTLTVEDAEAQVIDGEVDHAGLESLAAGLKPDQQTVQGRLRRAEAVPVLEVPATAVVSDADGAICVFVPEGDGFTPRSVTLAGGGVSRVNVAGGLSPGDQVLVNPHDLLQPAVCR